MINQNHITVLMNSLYYVLLYYTQSALILMCFKQGAYQISLSSMHRIVSSQNQMLP